MNRFLWIAVTVTVATLAVHALLAWWFLFRKSGDGAAPEGRPEPGDEDG